MFNNTLYIHGGEDLYDGLLDSMWMLTLDFMQGA
jgi:hypothetical protein